MANFKVVFGLKDGKSVQKEIKDKEADAFMKKKIGDVVKGEEIGLEGYEFEITGGSDKCGFPMRKDVQGNVRKRIAVIQGVGFKKKGKGQRQKKTVFGNTISSSVVQINLKVVKEGKKPLAEAPAEEGTAEGEAGEAPKEEKKEEAKPEEKKAEKKEEAKAEEPTKEEKKKEVKEEKAAEEKPKEEKAEEKPAEEKKEPAEEKKEEDK